MQNSETWKTFTRLIPLLHPVNDEIGCRLARSISSLTSRGRASNSVRARCCRRLSVRPSVRLSVCQTHTLWWKTEQHYMQVWRAIRDRCDNLGFQVQARSENFDFEIAAIWLHFVRRFRRSQFMHVGCILVKLCGGRYSAFVYDCAFLFAILLCNVYDFGLLIYTQLRLG